MPSISWLCPGAALNDLAQPFHRHGKGSERAAREGGEPSPADSDVGPTPSPSPGQSLQGPWARPGREAGAASPALGTAPLGLSSSALGSVSFMQQ